jgi:hypothetical protein
MVLLVLFVVSKMLLEVKQILQMATNYSSDYKSEREHC